MTSEIDIIAPTEAAEANQTYGALTEGLYLAGFTFERAMGRVLDLLKGDLWTKVGGGFTDVNVFVRSLRLDQFKVVSEQRKEFVERVKELQPEASNRAIAKALGVNRSTINRDAGANAPPVARKAPENRDGGGAFAPPSAADGRRDSRRINQRDEREERREEKLRSLGQAAALSGCFSVFYADPAWEDEFGPNARQTELHYPVMSFEDIKAMPVEQSSADDAVLYLWALPHTVPSALEVMAAWGFEYRTQIIWVKDKIGLGEWARQQHEVLLIGRRGAFPSPPESLRSPSVIEAPRGAHSAKPAIFAELIESWYPNLPKIELFCRGPARPGWSIWGNEAQADSESESAP